MVDFKVGDKVRLVAPPEELFDMSPTFNDEMHEHALDGTVFTVTTAFKPGETGYEEAVYAFTEGEDFDDPDDFIRIKTDDSEYYSVWPEWIELVRRKAISSKEDMERLYEL